MREEDEFGEADDGMVLSNVNPLFTEWRDLFRICGVHQRAGKNCTRQKGSESRNEEKEGGDGELDR